MARSRGEGGGAGLGGPPPDPVVGAPVVDADIYSEALEQQAAFVHEFLLTPRGAALLADDPRVRRQAATPAELARFLAGLVARATPFFVTAAIGRAIRRHRTASSCCFPHSTQV